MLWNFDWYPVRSVYKMHTKTINNAIGHRHRRLASITCTGLKDACQCCEWGERARWRMRRYRGEERWSSPLLQYALGEANEIECVLPLRYRFQILRRMITSPSIHSPPLCVHFPPLLLLSLDAHLFSSMTPTQNGTDRTKSTGKWTFGPCRTYTRTLYSHILPVFPPIFLEAH